MPPRWLLHPWASADAPLTVLLHRPISAPPRPNPVESALIEWPNPRKEWPVVLISRCRECRLCSRPARLIPGETLCLLTLRMVPCSVSALFCILMAPERWLPPTCCPVVA